MRTSGCPLLVLMLVSQFLVVVPAYAAGWEADEARILGDPAFLPLRGQVAGSFGYTYSAGQYDFKSSSPESWKTSTNAFLPSLSYGVTDDISISADLGWGNRRSQDSYIPFINFRGPMVIPDVTVRDRYRSLGAQNPDFGATWRAIDQRRAPVNVDLAVSYAPDIFTARNAGADNTGTVAAGGQSATLEASVSREMRVLTLRGYAAFQYDGRRNILQPGNFEDVRTGAHPDYAVGLQTETRILPWMALNAGVGAQVSAQFDEQFISPYGRTSETVMPIGTISPYASLVIPVLRRHLSAEFGYQHDFVGDEKIVADGGFTGKYVDRQVNLFFTRLLFVFGT